MLGSILGMFTGGGSSIMMYVVIGLVVTTLVGGFWLYQKSIVNDLQAEIQYKQEQIDVLKEQNAGLIIDKETLERASASLELELGRKSAEAGQIREELKRVNEIKDASQQRLDEFEAKLRDQERQDRIEKLRASRKASLILRITNKNIKCLIENFNRTDGTCIMGVFREGR